METEQIRTVMPVFNYERVTALILVGLLVLRIGGIVFSPLNLGPDEAQYWRWGETPAWGYFSKPPLIAWVIGASTSLFGNAEWAVRLPAPILHTGAAAALFYLARATFDARTGAYAAIGYMLMPGIILSSGVMATDGVLLPIWSFGLLCLWKLRAQSGDWRWAAGLGLAIGGGFLAKYAMVYFLIGMVLAASLDRPTRDALLSKRGLLVLALGSLVLAPHVAWSAANAFQTLHHTADNAHWGGQLFHPENALTFFADQMGIAGPIGVAVLVAAIWGVIANARRGTASAASVWLLCFCLPALAIILAQAITSRAHANWAATAYCAGSILIAAWLTREKAWPPRAWVIAGAIIAGTALLIPDLLLGIRICAGFVVGGGVILTGWLGGWRRIGLAWASFGLHAWVAAMIMVMALGPVAWSEALGFDQSFKRTRGWQATTAALNDAAALHEADSLLVDEREIWHGLDYYGRDGVLTVPVYTWQRNASPKSHAESYALPAQQTGRVLIANYKQHLQPAILRDFASVVPLGEISIALSRHEARKFKLFIAEGYQPAERSEAWEKRLVAEVDAYVAAMQDRR